MPICLSKHSIWGRWATSWYSKSKKDLSSPKSLLVVNTSIILTRFKAILIVTCVLVFDTDHPKHRDSPLYGTYWHAKKARFFESGHKVRKSQVGFKTFFYFDFMIINYRFMIFLDFSCIFNNFWWIREVQNTKKSRKFQEIFFENFRKNLKKKEFVRKLFFCSQGIPSKFQPP